MIQFVTGAQDYGTFREGLGVGKPLRNSRPGARLEDVPKHLTRHNQYNCAGQAWSQRVGSLLKGGQSLKRRKRRQQTTPYVSLSVCIAFIWWPGQTRGASTVYGQACNCFFCRLQRLRATL